MMEIKGNRKHLNLSDRINIEKGLNSSDSFKEIARTIQKDPTTVAKEVRRNARVKEYKGYGNIPCEANRDKHNPCGIMHVCGDQECTRICRLCHKFRCSDICKAYQPQQCAKLLKAPYVCNGCGKKVNCMLEKRIYSSKYAEDRYRCRYILRSSWTVSPNGLEDLRTPLGGDVVTDWKISELLWEGMSCPYG